MAIERDSLLSKYDPYGHPLIFDSLGSLLTTSAIGNRYMYTGREWDAESEIYYYQARMYDPVLGRFLQRDPLGYVDSLNLYSYVKNNSINLVDPSASRGRTPSGDAGRRNLMREFARTLQNAIINGQTSDCNALAELIDYAVSLNSNAATTMADLQSVLIGE